jgi:hypothetical protein
LISIGWREALRKLDKDNWSIIDTVVATMERLDEGFERSVNSASPAYTATPTMAPKNNR